LGVDALGRGEAGQALSHFDAARHYPRNLGEGKHLLTLETHLDYFAGQALSLGSITNEAAEDANAAWRRAANTNVDTGVFAYYRALALRSLGDNEVATALLRRLHELAEKEMDADVKIDYFATSLPNFLLFEDDLRKRNRIECLFLRAIVRLGLGRPAEAAVDLRQVLAMDRNHFFARFELDHLNRDTIILIP
jgi:tetratricopeptide (TPR) repeat protein